MNDDSLKPNEDNALREPEPVTAQTRRVWETPALEELSVQLSAAQPRVGRDGGVYADCTHS